MNILITGASGLLGKRLSKILSQNHCVYSLVRSIPQDKDKHTNYIEIDFSVDWDITTLPSDIDVIFHLAQSENFRSFPEKAMDIYQVNINSTAKLLDFSHKKNVKHFVYASSGGVYQTGDAVINENSPLVKHNKSGYYIASKLCSEILVQNYSAILNTSIMRIFFMYGLEQKKSMLIPRLVDNVRNLKPIQLQGTSGIYINPIHVSDVVKAFAAVLNKTGNQVYNIAGNQVLSIKDIAETYLKLTGIQPIYEMVDSHPQNLVSDISSMIKDLGAPEISIEKGLSEFV